MGTGASLGTGSQVGDTNIVVIGKGGRDCRGDPAESPLGPSMSGL